MLIIFLIISYELLGNINVNLNFFSFTLDNDSVNKHAIDDKLCKIFNPDFW